MCDCYLMNASFSSKATHYLNIGRFGICTIFRSFERGHLERGRERESEGVVYVCKCVWERERMMGVRCACVRESVLCACVGERKNKREGVMSEIEGVGCEWGREKQRGCVLERESRGFVRVHEREKERRGSVCVRERERQDWGREEEQEREREIAREIGRGAEHITSHYCNSKPYVTCRKESVCRKVKGWMELIGVASNDHWSEEVLTCVESWFLKLAQATSSSNHVTFCAELWRLASGRNSTLATLVKMKGAERERERKASVFIYVGRTIVGRCSSVLIPNARPYQPGALGLWNRWMFAVTFEGCEYGKQILGQNQHFFETTQHNCWRQRKWIRISFAHSTSSLCLPHLSVKRSTDFQQHRSRHNSGSHLIQYNLTAHETAKIYLLV